MSSDDKDALQFPAFDATPGEKYRQWRQNLFAFAAAKTDESGSSLADSLTDSDMGGTAAGALPLPAAGATRDKMVRLRAARQKASYALIHKHISDGDLRTILFSTNFQNGYGAYTFLEAAYNTPITRSELRDMDKLWTELSIPQDVGINFDSISRFTKLLQRVNSDRPVANRYGNNELCEKLLEAIADASRHFNENAMREYDAPAGTRTFEYPAAHPLFPGQRDFAACSRYYDNQWRQAVKGKIITIAGPLRRASGTAAARQAKEYTVPTSPPPLQGLSTPPSNDTLEALLAAGVELSSNTTTTSDVYNLPVDVIFSAVEGESSDVDFELSQCYDAEGVPSVELVCDNCRGIGHPRRLCPSPRRFRTFDFAIEVLRGARERADARAQQNGRPRGGRRFPPRGQRTPFRPRGRPPPASVDQPRRFAPPNAKQATDTSAEQSGEANRAVPQPLVFDDSDYFETANASSPPPSAHHALFVQEGEFSLQPQLKWPTPTRMATMLRQNAAWAVAGASIVAGMDAVARAVKDGLTLRMAMVSCLVILVAGVMSQPVKPPDHLGLIVGKVATLPGIVACVDSGATISCLSEKLALSGKVEFQVTNQHPRRKLRVASDQLLDIVAEGDLWLRGVNGFRVSNGKRVTGASDAKVGGVAVVRGLSENVILLSVRALKEQRIYTYFNRDNSNRVDDCIKLQCGLHVPFISSTHDLPVPAAVEEKCALGQTQWDVALRIHAALCHAGSTRVSMSRITYNGRPLPAMPLPHVCKGCRLGGSRAPASSQGRRRTDRPMARAPLDHFGQLIYSDCCVGFPPSFPHGFTAMINFCDGFSGERDRRFLTRADSTQVLGALGEYRNTNRHRLRDGRIGTWQTDNGNEFRGECLTDTVEEMINLHDFAVPNNRNANAVAERDWGVIERGIRACLAYADGAPECLWAWAAQQCSLIYYYLASTVHQPPTSPHDFLNPGRDAADLTWAKVLFCDVVVALPERDVRGKLWHRSADGCHLGYDARRRGHVIYCPRYRRLGTFTVTDWCGECRFTICSIITADTPVEYHQVDDLPMSPATSALLPAYFRAPRLVRAVGTGSERDLAARKALLTRSRSTEPDALALLAGETEAALCHGDDVCRELGAEVVAAEPLSAPQPELPDTVDKARHSPFWPLVKDALEAEIHGKFIDNQAWEVVPRRADMHVIRSKWVLKWTLKKDGSVQSVKARLVACGYSQLEGREFTAVYAKTLAAPSFRLFCSIVADEDLETDHIDAYKAFTQSDVDCVIFVEMPYGFARAGYVLRLKKALEGIRQGAHLWMEHNKTVLLSLGFKQSLTEASLYVHSDANIIVAVFADDIAAAYSASSISEYSAIKREYTSRIKVRTDDITPLAMFTGVNIVRNREKNTLSIDQTHYIDQLAEKYKGKFTLRNTPGPTNAAACRAFEKMVPGEPGQQVDQVEYLRLIGALLWVACMTRPDIAYFAAFLASFNSGPTDQHMTAAFNVLGYLVVTRSLGITYGGHLKIPVGLQDYPPGFVESRGLHTYHDSSWGTAPRPYGGYVVMRANGAISVSSRALKIVPDSTAEAETVMASKAAKETAGMRMIAEDIGRGVHGPTTLLGDNKAAYDIIVKSGSTSRTKYFERATLFVKRLYMLLVVVPYLVPTTNMVADILTKCTDKQMFYRMRGYMLNLSE